MPLHQAGWDTLPALPPMKTRESSKLVNAPSPDSACSAESSGSRACERGRWGRLVAMARECAMRELAGGGGMRLMGGEGAP